MPLQRDPATGKIKRNATTGKLVRSPAGNACCCGSACETCDACTTPEGILLTLHLHLPQYPGAHAMYESGLGVGSCCDGDVVAGCGPWTLDNNGDPCWHIECGPDGYAYDPGISPKGWHIGTQGDVTLSLTLQRADTLGYTSGDLATNGFADNFGQGNPACVYVLYQSPGTSVVVQSYNSPAECVVTDTYPLNDALDLIVVITRRENDDIGDSAGHCCSQWEVIAYLGFGNPLDPGGSTNVFPLYRGYFPDLDSACTLPVVSLGCDPLTYTDCSGEIDACAVSAFSCCFLKQNYVQDPGNGCWYLDTTTSCGSATFAGT